MGSQQMTKNFQWLIHVNGEHYGGLYENASLENNASSMHFEIARFCMLKYRIVVYIIPSQLSLMKILASSNVLLDLYGVHRKDIFL